ncbi:transcription elongation factor GreB [Pseudomarimonas salicorniae]|uniref:Transcription elongation factor GreB n=1 Tax=Pseudomarimonas salicorniae TaxID=2933270 RepID=A0ABT0GHV7_9GAMM|nr:transcription elongation factor GreB [Lysobacter sp. CAU 1642]MCK7594129.1 transcription elongation factor GreB [Lysobacter sp. CAU 1642]
MGRWRPPAEASTAIITRPGFERLKAELDRLWRVERPEVVKALAAAAAEGDRSENAEYTYRKKQLGEIDRRVRYLTRRLPQLKVVEQPPSHPERVWFGAELELEDADSGETFAYRIVGPDETEARQGWISIDSPLARALLGRAVDDEIGVELPGGRRHFVIAGVGYALLAASPG